VADDPCNFAFGGLLRVKGLGRRRRRDSQWWSVCGALVSSTGADEDKALGKTKYPVWATRLGFGDDEEKLGSVW